MEQFLRQHPITIAFAIGGGVVAGWLLDSGAWLVVGLGVGAIVGHFIDSRRG
jgi:hypothetical protein